MSTGPAAPRQARDVMAFGQETGRVVSDERVIGRSEPFAKVFQSSRLVKQAVGLTAWGILEDIALDATLDAERRLVAETSARRIADNLGINKGDRDPPPRAAARVRVRVPRGGPPPRFGPVRDRPIPPGPLGMHRAVHHHPTAANTQVSTVYGEPGHGETRVRKTRARSSRSR